MKPNVAHTLTLITSQNQKTSTEACSRTERNEYYHAVLFHDQPGHR